MSLAEKLITIAENEPKVYEAGKIFFENCLTNNFKRASYIGTFCESDMSGYKFSKTIYPVTSIEKIFYSYGGETLPEGIDFSKLDCSKAASYYRNAFGWLNKVTEIPDMNLPAIPYYTSTFSNSKNLKKIEVIRCNKNTVFQNPFSGCTALTSFKIEGEIGTDFNCYESPVSPETMLSVLTHLTDYVGTENAFKYSVLFNQKCWSALDDAYPSNPSGLPSWIDYALTLGWLA